MDGLHGVEELPLPFQYQICNTNATVESLLLRLISILWSNKDTQAGVKIDMMPCESFRLASSA